MGTAFFGYFNMMSTNLMLSIFLDQMARQPEECGYQVNVGGLMFSQHEVSP